MGIMLDTIESVLDEDSDKEGRDYDAEVHEKLSKALSPLQLKVEYVHLGQNPFIHLHNEKHEQYDYVFIKNNKLYDDFRGETIWDKVTIVYPNEEVLRTIFVNVFSALLVENAKDVWREFRLNIKAIFDRMNITTECLLNEADLITRQLKFDFRMGKYLTYQCEVTPNNATIEKVKQG